jgi:hypothetical protein
VISNTVYDQVRNKVAVGFDFLGQLEVKNIDGGVPSYAVRIGATQTAKAPADPPSAQEQVRKPITANAEPVALGERSYGVLAVIAAGLVVLNILTWHGVFWAAWPVLGIATAAGLRWARRNTQVDRSLATLAVVGAGLIGINLLSWHGTPWAIWPLLGLAVLAGIRWVTRQRGDI